MPGFDATFLNNVTREKYLPGLRNQIYKKPVMFNLLGMSERTQQATGRGLLKTVVISTHASTGLYGGYDTLANQPNNPTTNISLSYANYYATLAISGDEMRQNQGSNEKLADMVKIQTDNAYSTLREDLITDLYGSATARGGRNTIVGLAAAISASNTYAGVNRSTAGNENWQSDVNSSAHTLANLKDPTHASYFPSILRTSWGNAAFDGQPNAIVTTNKLYNLYQDIYGVQNLRGSNRMADLGMEGVMFQGNVDFTFDKYCTANYVFGLNTDSFEPYVFSDADFSLRGGSWREAENQDAMLAHVLWSGQIICVVPRENFVQTNVGAS